PLQNGLLPQRLRRRRLFAGRRNRDECGRRHEPRPPGPPPSPPRPPRRGGVGGLSFTAGLLRSAGFVFARAIGANYIQLADHGPSLAPHSDGKIEIILVREREISRGILRLSATSCTEDQPTQYEGSVVKRCYVRIDFHLFILPPFPRNRACRVGVLVHHLIACPFHGIRWASTPTLHCSPAVIPSRIRISSLGLVSGIRTSDFPSPWPNLYALVFLRVCLRTFAPSRLFRTAVSHNPRGNLKAPRPSARLAPGVPVPRPSARIPRILTFPMSWL
ncbi:MAG: hypothetical protein JWO87_3565, partial [Phycisphaerales bacterium]|nr:hypothetical protein [Phycisphaerales bacterium]